MKWKYTVNLKPVWGKYEDLNHEDFDNDKDLFATMKKEIVEELKKQIRPTDFILIKPTITKMEHAKYLSAFNALFNIVYDFCDYNKIWLKTSF
jgi:DeoR/GlpR family transcriptional regulator of sugar metabolism